MMIKNGFLSRIFVVILITLFTVTFSYAESHKIIKEVVEGVVIENLFPELTEEVEAEVIQADDEAELKRQADDEAELKRQADDEAELKRQADDEAELKRQADDEAELKRQADDEAELKRQADDEAELKRQADDEAELKRQADDEAELKRQADDEAELKRQAEANNSNFGLIAFFMGLFALITISLLVIITRFKVTIKSSFPFYTLERKTPVKKEDSTPLSEPLSEPLSKPKEPEVKILSSDIEGNISYQTESIKNLKNDIAGLLKNINDMNQTFMTLKTNLDQKDEEISRYKNGYDATIFKNFLLRFTRVDKVIKEYFDANKIDLNGLKDIQIQMDDALAECDVEIFSPEIGADFKTTIGVADNPEIRHTSNKAQDSTIAEILQPGYRRKLPDNSGNEYQIIIEAKVAIYVHKDT